MPNIINCYLLSKPLHKDKRIISTKYSWASATREKERTHSLRDWELKLYEAFLLPWWMGLNKALHFPVPQFWLFVIKMKQSFVFDVYREITSLQSLFSSWKLCWCWSLLNFWELFSILVCITLEQCLQTSQKKTPGTSGLS